MAIEEWKELENGDHGDLQSPLMPTQEEQQQNGSLQMVYLSTFVAVCGSFQFGSCVGYSAPAQAAIREDLNLSLSEYSMFGSILTIGAMFGAVTSGRIADYIGRKGAMRMSAYFCIIGWIAIYLSKESLSLDIGRVLRGYGIGVFSYVVPIFIAEIAPKNLRGRLTTLNQLLIVTGGSVAFLLGMIVTWRTLALSGLIPCTTLLVGLFFVPESPRWLAKVGQEKEFLSALQKLRGKNADISTEAAQIQIGVGLMVFQQFGGINGIGFFASETFASAGPLAGKIGTIAYACIQVPITVGGVILMDKSGRRPLIMVSAAGTSLGCFLAGASFFLKSHGLLLEFVPVLVVVGVLIFIAFFSIGMGAVPWVIMSEIFPINVKGIAGSIVVLVNWLGAWVVSFTFNFFMSWSSSGTFFIYSLISLMTILFVVKLVPETKGKTLEEIQASIDSQRDI
ncbi:sugar transporter ERD6-like 16 isoform X2 [Cucurbita pepo subsp. pepo]|uniref:sugar transporter ERD6-like 16 isoform X2 n=1 Tax=Cucurbita pepo subsp. pepo TaxID=3664 RepID=UPI000C9DA1AF|nr:sugar transporter ERD6-like 16 isoform X2 [Cucurbita pepo subsp. pepo]